MDFLTAANAISRTLSALPGWVGKVFSVWFRWWWQAGMLAKLLGAVVPLVVAGQVLSQSPATAGLSSTCYAATPLVGLVAIFAGLIAPGRR